MNHFYRLTIPFILLLVCVSFGFVDTPIASQNKVKGLSLKEANALINTSNSQQTAKDKDSLQSGWEHRKFTYRGKDLKFNVNTYGDKPSDGRSLYISMHGGGNAPSKVNDQQWDNQIKLTTNRPDVYNIQEGVVIVPRAPVDDWNMWFQYEMDNLLADAIRAATLFADVNPNKVYIMGYSAGGDGVYRLATRMADYWAAASMSAGHPGEAMPANLRNIGFALNMGGKDTPYDRNKHAQTWKTKLDSLQKADKNGYTHMVNIFENEGHWMNMKDAVAVPFMASFTRNPYPDKVVWTQNSFHIHQNFYWLGISKSETEREGIADDPQKVIQVSYTGNTIHIDHNYAAALSIFLNDKMMDLNKNVTVFYQGKKIFHGRVKRSANVIMQTAIQRKDSNYIFSAELIVNDNKNVSVAN